MPFPNFYVPSVGVKVVTDFERSRMSLSHPGGREQSFQQIYRRFITVARHRAQQLRHKPRSAARKI
jgi:hypothetical protein